MPKSALRKSCIAEETQERRRVTFCKTVEVYGYPPCSNFVESDCEECGESPELLADFTSEMGGEDVSIEEPEDYLVHKVVYENYEEMSPTGSLQDLRSDTIESDTIVYYPYESENELQEFVVHCVNMLEERKDNKSVKDCQAEITKESEQLSKLSIENIEQHNKLTENRVNIDSQLINSESLLNSNIILSPPLQELAVERLISAQSEEWLWNLDISPLNSTQESDSGSNISSEDTMIMMTSAECEKNEQRIQESLQKFQSIKKQKNLQQCDSPSITTHTNACLEYSKEQLTPVCTKSNENKLSEVKTPSLSSCHTPKSNVQESRPCIDNTKIVDIPQNPQRQWENEGCSVLIGICKSPLSSVSLDNALTSVQIPDDVRDWKIELQDELPHDTTFELSSLTVMECNNNNERTYENIDFDTSDLRESRSMSLPEYTSDELESFVDQYTERIERIKKRYSLTEGSWTPRRGIRPRFGSTVQILQQLQNEGQSSLLNHHHSWPCSSSSSSSSNNFAETQRSSLLKSQSNLIQHAVNEISEMFNKTDTAQNIETEQNVNLNNCLHLTFQERGVPEGSSPSPPPLSSELLCDKTNQSSDGVIYYSMNV